MSDAAALRPTISRVDFRQGGGASHRGRPHLVRHRQGETLALVGESGSGKSVTALSILKLLPYPPASHPSGKILFKGSDLLGHERAASCARCAATTSR